jgi:hypothetical protein
MAERALTPAGKILKWIVIPAALLAGGFYLIGPHIGGAVPNLPGSGGVNVTPVADNDGDKDNFASPDVDVQSAPSLSAPDVRITARQRPKHRRQRSKPVVAEDPNAKEPVDAYAPTKPAEPKSVGIGT